MSLQSTLEQYVLQLKNVPRMLFAVAGVVQKMMKTLYEVSHFPDAETRRPGRNPACPDADILTIAWKPLEYIGADSELSGYRMSNKFGASLLGAFLNQCLGRPLMKLKDLVLA